MDSTISKPVLARLLRRQEHLQAQAASPARLLPPKGARVPPARGFRGVLPKPGAHAGACGQLEARGRDGGLSSSSGRAPRPRRPVRRPQAPLSAAGWVRPPCPQRRLPGVKAAWGGSASLGAAAVWGESRFSREGHPRPLRSGTETSRLPGRGEAASGHPTAPLGFARCPEIPRRRRIKG